jgi:hypothetical protein
MLDTPHPVPPLRQGEGTFTGPFRDGGKTGISPSPRGSGTGEGGVGHGVNHFRKTQ